MLFDENLSGFQPFDSEITESPGGEFRTLSNSELISRLGKDMLIKFGAVIAPVASFSEAFIGNGSTVEKIGAVGLVAVSPVIYRQSKHDQDKVRAEIRHRSFTNTQQLDNRGDL